MTSKDNEDWRTEDYDGYLNGAAFRLKKFVSTETNDHEHCAFCWQKITDLKIEDADAEGYCAIYPTTGQEHWVCKKCFNDFNKQFDFKLY